MQTQVGKFVHSLWSRHFRTLFPESTMSYMPCLVRDSDYIWQCSQYVSGTDCANGTGQKRCGLSCLFKGVQGQGLCGGEMRKIRKQQIFLVILVILEFHLKGFAHWNMNCLDMENIIILNYVIRDCTWIYNENLLNLSFPRSKFVSLIWPVSWSQA